MTEYLAKYRIESYMFDGGAWMPDPDARIREHRFEAGNDEEARKIAIEHMKDFKKLYFSPTSRLEQLLRIEEVKINGT